MRVILLVALLALSAAFVSGKTTTTTSTSTRTIITTKTSARSKTKIIKTTIATITSTKKTKRSTRTTLTTTTTTTTTTTVEPTINPAWLVGPYAFAKDWLEHKMCRFQLFKSKLSFTDARNFCGKNFARASSVHLAFIPDQETNDFLLALDPDTNTARWIGASRSDEGANFVWLDESAVAYTNWDFGEPNSNSTATGNPDLELYRSRILHHGKGQVPGQVE